MPGPATLPQTIESLDALEDTLSSPSEGVIKTMAALEGDIIILGVGGKMGPSLAHMAKRATDAAGRSRRIIGVSRFSSPQLPAQLHSWGIETLACDLLDEAEIGKLPDAPNIVYMAGMKFGSTGNESLTWAMNTYLPALVSRKYRDSRIAAFSTGNIYGLVPVNGTGSTESDKPNPVGEYAMSCLGRERMFEHFSRTLNIKMTLLRLNYATELRYGVLVDLARRVWAGETVDVTMGHVNVIFQGDANAMSLQSLEKAESPPFLLNVAGPDILKVRDICEEFGKLMGKPVHFTGTEAPDALLNDGSLGRRTFGKPRVGVDQMLKWIAAWVSKGGASLGKPTHFESRSGKF